VICSCPSRIGRIFSNTEYQKRFPRPASGVRPPVFVDSPLGLEITKIYSSLREFWDDEGKALMDKADHPIRFEGLYGVEKHADHCSRFWVLGTRFWVLRTKAKGSEAVRFFSMLRLTGNHRTSARTKIRKELKTMGWKGKRKG